MLRLESDLLALMLATAQGELARQSRRASPMKLRSSW